MIRLNFSTQAKTFGAIDPGAQYRENETVQQGFTIAKQNCLRCHFMGAYGGTKSGETWMTLSRKALNHPAAFAAYIRDPKQENPQAEMPGNPQYDAATRAALTAYFRTFSEAGLDKK